MKTIRIRIFLVLFLMVLASGSTMARGIQNVTHIPAQKEKTEVDVHAAPNVPIVVQLEDSNGSIVFSDKEKSSTYNYKKIYDFSSLEDGTYTFVVRIGNENNLKSLVVKDGNVQITGQDKQLSPDFKLEGKYLEFTYPNLEEKEARLLLYDKDNGYWVYQENLVPEFDIQQALNLSKLNSGNYMAVLISGEDVYDYDFELH